MLFNRAIFKFKAEVLYDTVGVVGFFNIDSEGIIVVNGVDEFKEVEHIDADDNFVHFAFVKFEVVCFKVEVNEDGM